MRKFCHWKSVSRWAALLGLTLCCSCGGSLRAAVVEHAEASRSVALTLARAAAELRCDANKEDAAAQCKTVVGVIETQAQALRDSAERLQRAAK